MDRNLAFKRLLSEYVLHVFQLEKKLKQSFIRINGQFGAPSLKTQSNLNQHVKVGF